MKQLSLSGKHICYYELSELNIIFFNHNTKHRDFKHLTDDEIFCLIEILENRKFNAMGHLNLDNK